MQPIAPYCWSVNVAGRSMELPVFQADDDRAIALLMVIDRGLRFVDNAGQALAHAFRPLAPEIVVGSATLGIPVAMAVSRALGLDDYIILQKSPKFHLADALVEDVRSITSPGPQRLLLDRQSIERLHGRRVVVVDDVVATGSSIAAAMRLVRRAGADICAIGTILTEGDGWRAALGRDAILLHRLGHIPQFRVKDGMAKPLPDTADLLVPAG